jgi:hypothetical protein
VQGLAEAIKYLYQEFLLDDEAFWGLLATEPDLSKNPNTLAQLQNWFRYRP